MSTSISISYLPVFYFCTDLNIFICYQCKEGQLNLAEHLRKSPNHNSLTTAVQEQIIASLKKSELQIAQTTVHDKVVFEIAGRKEAIPQVAIQKDGRSPSPFLQIYNQGYACKKCTYRTTNHKNIRKHLNQEHQQSSKRERGSKEEDYLILPMQTVFSRQSSSTYLFTVTLPTSVSSSISISIFLILLLISIFTTQYL